MPQPTDNPIDEHSLTQRQEAIVAQVRGQGFVAIEALAREFQITPQTVRRDINTLCDLGLLQRYHGGAGLPSSTENIAYETRQAMNIDGKRQIAGLVARHIPANASVSISLGTTAQETARALRQHGGLRVVTNNLRVAGMLSSSANIEIMMAGGLVRHLDAGVTGESAIEFFRNFHVDYALISISAIEADGSLLDFDYHEVRLLQVIIANARKRYLLADISKFGRNALIRAGNITDMDALFTDRKPTGQLARVIEEAGLPVHIAGPDDAIA